MKYKHTIHTLNKYLIDVAKQESEMYPRLKALKILLLCNVKHYLDTNERLYNDMDFFCSEAFIDHNEIWDKFKFFAAYDIEYNSKDEFETSENIDKFIEKNKSFIMKLIKMKPWELTKYYHNIVFENTTLFKDKNLDMDDLQVMALNMRKLERVGD